MNQQGITDYQYFLASPFFAELADFEAPDTKIFIKSFCELSLLLRDFLSSPDVAVVIISLGEKYGLQEKQVSNLSKVIRDLILGKVFIKDLPIKVSSSLGIDEAKSSQLTNELVSQSFGPITEEIKHIQRTKFPDRITQMKSAVQQPPSRPEFKMPPPIQTSPPPQPIRPIQQDFRVVSPSNPQAQGEKPVSSPLEDELEKVASIIDLRNKPRE